eukprot:6203125-Pleurochrysis_carterae.AAC.4
MLARKRLEPQTARWVHVRAQRVSPFIRIADRADRAPCAYSTQVGEPLPRRFGDGIHESLHLCLEPPLPPCLQRQPLPAHARARGAPAHAQPPPLAVGARDRAVRACQVHDAAHADAGRRRRASPSPLARAAPRRDASMQRACASRAHARRCRCRKDAEGVERAGCLVSWGSRAAVRVRTRFD